VKIGLRAAALLIPILLRLQAFASSEKTAGGKANK